MKIEIGTNEAGQRLDKFLRKYFKDVPLSAIFKALRKGDIRVNGTKKKENYVLELGDEIEVRYLQSKKESNSSKEVNFIKVNSGSMKVTDKVSDTLVRLPMYYELNEDDLTRIFEVIERFFEEN